MKKKGFTYIEVAIAFSIFALVLLFVMKMNHTTSTVMNRQREKTKKFYIAQLYMERYKSNHIKQTVDLTENFEGYEVGIKLVSDQKINVLVNGASKEVTPKKITVTVRSINGGTNNDTDVTINNHLIVDN
jgi:type II secretory pathway pseudopilin PulG